MDNEIKGVGNSINYKFRMHDPRIGRFFAVDPLVHKYTFNSPYAFAENMVISHVELEGAEGLWSMTDFNKALYKSELYLNNGDQAAAEEAMDAYRKGAALGSAIGLTIALDGAFNGWRITKATAKDLAEQLAVKTVSNGDIKSAVFEVDIANAFVKGIFEGIGIKGVKAKWIEEGMKTMFDVNLKQDGTFNFKAKDDFYEIATEYTLRMIIAKTSDKIKGKNASEKLKTSLSVGGKTIREYTTDPIVDFISPEPISNSQVMEKYEVKSDNTNVKINYPQYKLEGEQNK
jgi:hypothetical protein